jgi:hypothetical protein
MVSAVFGGLRYRSADNTDDISGVASRRGCGCCAGDVASICWPCRSFVYDVEETISVVGDMLMKALKLRQPRQRF